MAARDEREFAHLGDMISALRMGGLRLILDGLPNVHLMRGLADCQLA